MMIKALTSVFWLLILSLSALASGGRTHAEMGQRMFQKHFRQAEGYGGGTRVAYRPILIVFQ